MACQRGAAGGPLGVEATWQAWVAWTGHVASMGSLDRPRGKHGLGEAKRGCAYSACTRLGRPSNSRAPTARKEIADGNHSSSQEALRIRARRGRSRRRARRRVQARRVLHHAPPRLRRPSAGDRQAYHRSAYRCGSRPRACAAGDSSRRCTHTRRRWCRTGAVPGSHWYAPSQCHYTLATGRRRLLGYAPRARRSSAPPSSRLRGMGRRRRATSCGERESTGTCIVEARAGGVQGVWESVGERGGKLSDGGEGRGGERGLRDGWEGKAEFRTGRQRSGRGRQPSGGEGSLQDGKAAFRTGRQPSGGEGSLQEGGSVRGGWARTAQPPRPCPPAGSCTQVCRYLRTPAARRDSRASRRNARRLEKSRASERKRGRRGVPAPERSCHTQCGAERR